jgi:hypothetical protein
MLIVWGTKVRHRTLGYVADLCPACRKPTAHSFHETVHVPHVYYIPTERGKAVGYGIACHSCGLQSAAAPQRYAAMSLKPARLDVLQRATNPNLHSELAEIKDREERARRGELSAAERIAEMQESLSGLEGMVEKRAAVLHFDAHSGLLALATLSLPWFLIVPGVTRQDLAGELLFYAGIGSLGLGLGLLVHALTTDVSRFIRRRLGPQLRDQLQRLRPSPAELDRLIESMKASGWTLGYKLDPQWLSRVVLTHAIHGGRVS